MFFLALKQLFSRKRQSILILFGILLGTAAYIVISGMMLGFQEYTIEQLLNNISQITVSAQQNYVTAKLLDKSMFSKNTLVKWTVPPSGLRNTAHIEYPNGWYQRLSKDPRVVAY